MSHQKFHTGKDKSPENPFLMIYPLDQLKPNMYIKLKTETQNNIVIFGIFSENDTVNLAFFEKI